jgi:N-acetylmuramate 1-kinase
VVQDRRVDARLELLTRWVTQDLGLEGARIAPASADASFRRYFRVVQGGVSRIVMDAPPDKEDLGPFLRVARMLAQVGVNAPQILAADEPKGLLLLSDLGSELYLSHLNQAAAAGEQARIDALYGDALDCLALIQREALVPAQTLPVYDRAMLLREMELLPEWFLGHHLGLTVDGTVRGVLDATFEALVGNAHEQPASFVHRDYHSRNLMVCEPGRPGVLDFQDAVRGPITYDLVSLLKDCYISWPTEQVRAWALAHRARLTHAGLPAGRDDAQFLQWFDLMGLQRHIKVLGIFARLWYRDGKAGYLKDLPLVLRYTRETAQRYPQTAAFATFIAQRIDPLFEPAQRRALAPA